jgi:hypothetical protein
MAERTQKKEKKGKAKSISKEKQRRAPNVKSVFPDLDEDSDEHKSCDLRGSKYCIVHTWQKGWLDQKSEM